MAGASRMRQSSRSRATITPLAILVALSATALLQALGVHAWLVPGGVEEQAKPALPGRREALQTGAAAASLGLWSLEPDHAHAFRNDRIINAKKSYVPTIRERYQILEGFRDDIYLTVELEPGNESSRIKFEARPANWYSGRDSSLDGEIVLLDNACKPIDTKIDGRIALIPRGLCTFYTKINNALDAGAKAVIVYDQKTSNMPLESQGKTGAVRSKGISTRSAGDALYGGVSLLPTEKGKTIMGVSANQEAPKIDGAMINLQDGEAIADSIKSGFKPRVLDVTRFTWPNGMDKFIKKDLKKMLNEMEIYGFTQRESKDSMDDPILKVLKKDRNAFADAVREKDYTGIRQAFAKWNSDFDNLGKWDLFELF